MILGFVLGWAAATWWWPYVLSFYDTRRPVSAEELNRDMRPWVERLKAGIPEGNVRLEDNGTDTYVWPPIGTWRPDGGP